MCVSLGFYSENGGNLRAVNRPTNRPIPLPGQPVFKSDLGPPVLYRPVTRPPLAGPYAFSRIPTPNWNGPRVFLPHDIANTWLFANISSGYAPPSSLTILYLLLSSVFTYASVSFRKGKTLVMHMLIPSQNIFYL